MANYEDKIKKLLNELTLEEKIGMIHGAGLFRTEGVDRLSIPPFKFADGPMGVRQEFDNGKWIPINNSDDYVTYLPSGSAVASTWNRELAKKLGLVLGAETRGRGKDMILAPSANIIRSPLCGRNFEYLSEDPVLTEEIAKQVINGIQESDVACCLKHFVANNQETERLDIEAIMEDRTLHEIYLKAFKGCVMKTDALGIMGAYNKIKGETCCESDYLLNKVLKEEYGFKGMVVSDWGGVKTTKAAVESGLDIEMSVFDNFDDYLMANPLLDAIKKGEFDELLVDKKVTNILRVMFKTKMIDADDRKSGTYNTPEHRQFAYDIAKESVILLKNDGILPLDKKTIKKVLVIGDNGNKTHSNGGGSAEIKSLYEITPLMGISKELGGNATVDFVPGYFVDDEIKEGDTSWQETSLEAQALKTENTSEHVIVKRNALKGNAIKALKDGNYDQVIFIGGLNHYNDLEGQDRADIKLPYGQEDLINELLAIVPNMIITFVGGSPVGMNSFVNKAKAIMWTWYAGLEGGTVFAKTLFGEINPSGKLNQTFAKKLSDYSSHSIGEFPGDLKKLETLYSEEIYVGYRHFDTNKIEPDFCFGYGLSYTDFIINDSKATLNETNDFLDVTITTNVTNIGTMDGAEVVQVYVKSNTDYRPTKELQGFEKVYLTTGKTKEVCIKLDKTSFGFYSEKDGKFKTLPGKYEILIGNSSKNIIETLHVEIKNEYLYI